MHEHERTQRDATIYLTVYDLLVILCHIQTGL
jgi:hypothetical protein